MSALDSHRAERPPRRLAEFPVRRPCAAAPGWRNWGVVERGRLYRSNHPTPWQLKRAVRRYGIRTIINLRGHRADCGSDVLGRAAAVDLGLEHIDAPLESRGAPHKDRVLRLAGIFARMDEPALIHCKSGADPHRARGRDLAAGAGAAVEQAMEQLSLRHGPCGGGTNRDSRRLLPRLCGIHEGARPKPFLDWVRDDYSEDALRASFHSTPWADRLVDGVLRRE